MSIFQRMNDIINASINDLLDRVEDPERMIKQIIREMEDNIAQAKEGVIDAIASEKQLEKELERHRKQADSWHDKARQALANDKEELARSALAQKKEIDRIIENLEPSWESAAQTSQRLKKQLKALEQRLDEAKRKRTTLQARQRAAQARTQMSQTMDTFQNGLDAQHKFDRMEDKVSEMEARSEAIDELEDDNTPLEKEFLEMEIDQDIEAELAAMKKDLDK
ncbi:PspA/IM30 family protein [Candidatus Venteria ishoeyi]|uniref:PspA/IM30 family protein n=1 Tax=Candidatus Venteria ishoeyi TaxID=1899563 RepID=UPI0025A5075B|nr:PspA/IM30 family protein [Candidatus Venteria ishoeyi]MDM8546520.1 PspA/IM30 family protein [Candidatus Venteria ishoeyi]